MPMNGIDLPTKKKKKQNPLSAGTSISSIILIRSDGGVLYREERKESERICKIKKSERDRREKGIEIRIKETETGEKSKEQTITGLRSSQQE